MIKVLIDGRPIRQPVSGVARYCLGLVNGLGTLRRPVDVHVFCQNWKGTNFALKELPISVQSLAPDKLPPFYQNVLFEFCPSFATRVVGADRFDIVHETYFAPLGAKSSRVKKVVTIHDIIPIDAPDYFGGKNRFFSRRNFFRQCAEADRIIFVSEYTKVRAEAVLNRRIESTVIPCGVSPPTALAPSSELNRFGIDRHEYVLYVGNVEPRKNLVRAAQAFSRSSIGSRMKFVVAGFKNYKAAEILDEMQRILGPRLLYVGAISESLKWRLLTDARAFVFPSLYEGFGIPLIECFIAGCPSVHSSTTSLAELALSPLQTFDPTDVDQMARAMDRVVQDDGLRAELIGAGLVRARRFAWPEVASRTADVYEQVVGSSVSSN